MRTSEILREEHRWIRLMLDCLEKLLEDARVRGEVNPEATAELLYIFEEFADGEHQRKEEEALLPLLLTKTSDSDEDSIGELPVDHLQERELLHVMRSDLMGAVLGEPRRFEEFTRDSSIYIELQRKHLDREEAVLLPMIERSLTPEDDSQVVAGFKHVEATGTNLAGVFERIKALCHRLDVPGAD